MSTRSGWTLDGKHFVETVGVNGRTTYHIDGKLTPWPVWIAAYRAAKAAQAAKAEPRCACPQEDSPELRDLERPF